MRLLHELLELVRGELRRRELATEGGQRQESRDQKGHGEMSEECATRGSREGDC